MKVITVQSKNIIQQEKIKDIKKYFGKVDLDNGLVVPSEQ